MPEKSEKSSDSDQMLDKVVKAIPLGYAFLVFCGALYLHIFYHRFGIVIFQYLDVSEILLSFINFSFIALLPFIALIILFLIYIFSISKLSLKIKGEMNWVITGKADMDPIINLIDYWNDRWWLNVAYILAAMDTFLSLNSYASARTFSQITFYVFMFFSFWYSLDIKLERIPKLLINLVLLFVVGIIFNSENDIFKISHRTNNKMVSIITSDSTIVTDTHYYFIGRTNNYVFIYNSLDSSTDIIPSTQIKKISFK